MKTRISRKDLYDQKFSNYEELIDNVDSSKNNKFKEEQIENTVLFLDFLFEKYCNTPDTELSCDHHNTKEEK